MLEENGALHFLARVEIFREKNLEALLDVRVKPGEIGCEIEHGRYRVARTRQLCFKCVTNAINSRR